MTYRRSAALLLGVLFLLSGPKPLCGQDKTTLAIDKGIDYLLPATQKRLEEVAGQSTGGVVPTQQNGVGRLAMQVYALVVAGVSVDNPTIRESFQLLERMSFRHTYSVALYAFALDAAISQVEDDMLLLQPPRVRARFRDNPNIGKQYRARLKAAVEHFARTQNQQGGWRYGPGARDFDNSNVQFAVLALGLGSKRSIPVEPTVWMKVMDHFVKGQQKKGPETKNRLTMKPPEERHMRRHEKVNIIKKSSSRRSSGRSKKKDAGKTGVFTAPKTEDPEIGTEGIQVFERGWDYQNKGGATWNMSCAGLSSLLLARDALRGQLQPDAKKAIDKAIWDGYGWLMGHWSPTGNYYGMYSLEKVGDIGEVLKFASHDWYKELSDHLLSAQKPDGSWAKGKWADDAAIATSYALLILNRATSLLAMDRTHNVVLSGKRGGVGGVEDRSWVYIRELNTSFHAPTLFRAVRLRPTAKLIQFLKKIVINYPANYRGELVPQLVNLQEALASNKTASPRAAKRTRKIIDDYLTAITGHSYDNPETYMKWARRWKRVMAIAESRKPSYGELLLKYYKTTNKSVPLRKAVMRALVQCKVRESIPLLLQDMENPDPAIREEAYNRFRDFFIDFPPPFSAKASDSTRSRQLEAIRQWYAKQS